MSSLVKKLTPFPKLVAVAKLGMGETGYLDVSFPNCDVRVHKYTSIMWGQRPIKEWKFAISFNTSKGRMSIICPFGLTRKKECIKLLNEVLDKFDCEVKL